jgi:ABC-type polysaccharide/polyol phosphate transport system ATPase subunit
MGESRASKMRLKLQDAILFEPETLIEQTKISLVDATFFD